MTPRYEGLAPERLAARLAADVIDLDKAQLDELARWLDSRGWELRKLTGRPVRGRAA